MATHQDDLLGAEALGGQHRHQADGAVADHRDPAAGAGTNQPVVAAAVVIIVLPMIVASILLQRKFIEGVTGGSSR